MPPTIEIDNDVYARLGAEATPFVETTPNQVLRRLLGLNASSVKPVARQRTAAEATPDAMAPAQLTALPDVQPALTLASRKAKFEPRTRARRGSLLHRDAYELPILRALQQAGGRAASREVVDAVGVVLSDQFTEQDKQELRSGEARWRNRAHFSRLRLVEQGLLKGDSPRGVWEISLEGVKRLEDEG